MRLGSDILRTTEYPFGTRNNAALTVSFQRAENGWSVRAHPIRLQIYLFRRSTSHDVMCIIHMMHSRATKQLVPRHSVLRERLGRRLYIRITAQL